MNIFYLAFLMSVGLIINGFVWDGISLRESFVMADFRVITGFWVMAIMYTFLGKKNA